MSVSLSDLARIGGAIHVTTSEREAGCTVPAAGLAAAFAAVERRFSVGGGRRDPSVRERVIDATVASFRARPGGDLTPEEAHAILWFAMNGPNGGDLVRKNCARLLRTSGTAEIVMIGTGGAFGFPGDGSERPKRVTGRQEAEATLDADMLSGAGYPVDRHLRTVLDDYVTRTLRGIGGIDEQMSSVAFGAFMQRRAYAGTGGEPFHSAQLMPERDHAFDLGDFLDATASGAVGGDALDHLSGLRDGLVHHFSPLSPKARTLSDDSDTVVVGGFSCVRRGRRLSWFMLGGPERDLDYETVCLRGLRARSQEPGLAGLPPDTLRAVPLAGTDDVWANALWGVFDIPSRTHVHRGLTSEAGHTVDILLGGDPAGAHPLADQILQRVPVDLMVEAAEACFGLPAYFAQRVHALVDEPRTTRIAGSALDPGAMPGLGPAADDRKTQVRIVRTLLPVRVPRPEPAPPRKYTPPRYLVAVEGHWRTISEGSVGKGPDDLPVRGKTWVRYTEKYTDNPRRPAVIYVKEPVLPVLAALPDAEPEDVAPAAPR